jgi:CubicO group peptidase (beta-lactamase class C family)
MATRNQRSLKRTAFYLLAGVSLPIFAAAAASNDLERMQSDIELRVANQHFMGAVLVAKGDRLLIDQGYGFADLEWNAPNTPETRFRIASITKQFTAAAILLLQERGKLRVEAPLKTYLPNTPQAWDEITIFNLLTHTSGIPDFIRLADFRNFMTLPERPEQIIATIRDKPLDFAPGSEKAYSNSGYVLLGLVIEKVSGESYAQFVKENLLDPAGMRDSGYDTHAAVIDRRASGYTYGPGGFENAAYFDMNIPFAAGGLYSTTGDLLRWERALFGGKILSQASLEQMTTPFKENYGFGLVIRMIDGEKIVDHSGSFDGFNTEMIHGARDNLVVIVLSNVSGPATDQLADDLFKIAHGDQVELISDRKAVHLAGATLEKYEGYYEFPDGDLMRVWRHGDRFLTRLQAEPAVEFFPQSERDFFAKVVDEQITFEVQNGSAAAFVLHQNGKNRPAKRLEEAVGKQRSEELAERIKNQTPAPGTEGELHRHVAEMQAGTPDYARMSPEVAEAVRAKLASGHSLPKSLGAVQAVQFESVSPAGVDVYEVTFEHGTVQWRIKVGPDGKIWTSLFNVQL